MSSLTTDEIFDLLDETGNINIPSDVSIQDTSNPLIYLTNSQLTTRDSSPILCENNNSTYGEDIAKTIPLIDDEDNHNDVNEYYKYNSKQTRISGILSSKRVKKREVYRFETDFLVSSVAWSNELSDSLELAISSYIETYQNKIQLIKLNKDDDNESLTLYAETEHPYPPTKILWIPRSPNVQTQLPQLIATTADYLRIWQVKDNNKRRDNSSQQNKDNNFDSSFDHASKTGASLVVDSNSEGNEVKLVSLLNSNKAPLTSFDWNEFDLRILTSSLDSTCAIWDLEVGKLVTGVSLFDSPSSSSTTTNTTSSLNNDTNNLIGSIRSSIVTHNSEVYDVSFSKAGTGRDIFVSVGNDGTVRLFDLRMLAKSTILFEMDNNNTFGKSLVRVACNKLDSNIVSTFSTNSKDIIVLDVRKPGRPSSILSSHLDDINSMAWAPHSPHHLCSGSNDKQALIWEISKSPVPMEPLLAYRATGKINTISWSAAHSEWISIGYKNYLELLRV